jgi:hypothetical protein
VREMCSFAACCFAFDKRSSRRSRVVFMVIHDTETAVPVAF